MLSQHVAHAQQAELAEQASLRTLAEAAARAREAEAEVEVALEAVAECDEQAVTQPTLTCHSFRHHTYSRPPPRSLILSLRTPTILEYERPSTYLLRAGGGPRHRDGPGGGGACDARGGARGGACARGARRRGGRGSAGDLGGRARCGDARHGLAARGRQARGAARCAARRSEASARRRAHGGGARGWARGGAGGSRGDGGERRGGAGQRSTQRGRCGDRARRGVAVITVPISSSISISPSISACAPGCRARISTICRRADQLSRLAARRGGRREALRVEPSP